MRPALSVLAIFAMLVASPPARAVKTTPKSKPAPMAGPVPTLQRPDAKALLRQAQDLWKTNQDYTGALAKFNAAVDADPSDNELRLQRAHFFEVLSALVVPEEKKKFEDRAHDDYSRIAASDPDSIIAGIARDGLTRLAGSLLIKGKAVTCPSDAAEAHARADSLYGARQFAEAAAEYEKAATGCPEDAAYWVDFADAHYVLEEYEKAKELFDKALSVDPWNRKGHRFLADTQVRLKDNEAAVHQLVLAVVSDPIYEAGWSALKTYATAMGRTWLRVYRDKTAIATGPEPDPDGLSWLAYRVAKAGRVDPKATSALAIERHAVSTALAETREVAAKASRKPGPFWEMMARAESAGFLDEAIFLHMLDAPLAAEYPAFREQNVERLVAYLETVVVP